MTSLKNSVIINHRVLHPASAGADAKHTYTSTSVHKYLDYTAREGRHEERGGCDERITRHDLELELEKAGNDIHAALEYGNRSGRFADKGIDMPFKEGEVSGGIWDANGIRELADVEREIMDSGSNVVQSVLCVSREWAESLGMSTKEDWQRLLRTSWVSFMAAWDVIRPEDCRWVAEYHVDAANSLHVHVMSWDASGRYCGPENLPYEVIETSKRVIREEIMKDVSLGRSLQKDYVRQAILELSRNALGKSLTPEALANVKDKAARAGEVFELVPYRGNRRELEEQLHRIVETLPASGIGRRGYDSQTPETKVQTRFAMDILKEDPEIGRLAGEWKLLVEHGADILGLSGEAREQYVSDGIRDLDKRLADVVLDRAVRDNKPWERDASLRAQRLELVGLIRDAVSLERRAELAEASSRQAAREEVSRALSSPGVREAYLEYRGSVLAFVRENAEKPLLRKQEERLFERVAKDVEGYAAWTISHRPSGKARTWQEHEIRRGLGASARELVYRALREQELSRVALTKQERKAIARCVAAMAREINRGKAPSQLRDAAKPAIEIIACKPELAASVDRAYALNSRTLGAGGRVRLAKGQREAIFEELVKAARREADTAYSVKAAGQSREEEASRDDPVDDVLFRAMRTARVSRVIDGYDGGDLEVRIKHKNYLLERSR